jgi:hypothetical protein
MVLLVEWPKADLDLMKFVQDRFQNNLQENTNGTDRRSAKAYWTAIITDMTFLFRHIITGRDVDPPLYSRKVTPEYGMETSNISSQKEVQVQNSNVDGKSHTQGPILEHYQERVEQ